MSQMEQFVWDRLSVAKYAIGRRRIKSFVWMASDLVAHGQDAKAVASQLCQYGRDREMGVVATLIFSAIVNHIVRLVIEWYRNRGIHA